MATKRSNSKRIRSIRDQIKDSYSTCFFCGEYISRSERTIDHLEALANGGEDEAENMVVSCVRCNYEKSDLELYEYVNLKLNNFDFKGRAEKNKRKKGFGFEGAIYEEHIVLVKDIISSPRTQPSIDNIRKRTAIYKKKGSFIKPTYVKKVRGKYIVLQGFINYIIIRNLGITTMPVTVVKNT